MQFNRTIRGVVASAAVAGVGVSPGVAQQPSFRSGWVRVQPVRKFSSAAHGKLGSEIQSMLPAGHMYLTAGESNVNAAHETTHGVNSRIRQTLPSGWNAFFVGQGTAFVLREPRVRLSDVLRFVPGDLRGGGCSLYLQQQQRDWNDQPTYVLDEWTAYTNGAIVGFDIGRPEWMELERAIEFGGYATALLLAVEDLDPDYADKDALAEFVGWQLSRVCLLSEKAKKSGQWRGSHETLASRFQARFVRDEK